MAPDDSCCGKPNRGGALGNQSFSVALPSDQSVPLVFASPHSGQEYPPEIRCGLGA